MRSYSSAVILCWASNCGVTVVGAGTTAEEVLVIVNASIVAWESRTRTGMRMWKAGCNMAIACGGSQLQGANACNGGPYSLALTRVLYRADRERTVNMP